MAVRPLTSPERFPSFMGDNLATAAPPYDFEGVTLRYFPLKANFHTLANFCDDYLNMVPPEIAYFRPAMPFVMLMIVNYGRMSVDLGNLGWTSQNELLFSVPLEWYRKVDGRFVFQDAATIAPYIFVDSEASQSAGREVLGWPKVQGWFTRGIDAWARHPRSRREVLTMTTRVFRNLYQNEENTPRELLVVEEDPSPTVTEFPPDPNNPLNPLVSIPQALISWSNMAMQTMEMMTRSPLRGYSDVDRTMLARLPNLTQLRQAMGQSLQGNTINLKQMRDAGRPGRACYQAITNAKMEVTQFHRGGMLGDAALLRGDISGGYRIRLNRYESQPIIDVLGLEVHEERSSDDLTSAYLRPVMPFWQEMDMRYLAATNICWRTGELDWRNSEVELEPESAAEAREAHLYNTTGSAGLQVATGPFRFDNTTIRVLPLLADRGKLNQMIRSGLPHDVKEFQAYGSYVYVRIFSYGDMHSETNDMGDWADKTVEFAIPVRCSDKATGRLDSVGYFCPFLFNNSSIGVTTGREVYGWPVSEAQIQSPRNDWLETDRLSSCVDRYLKVSGEVFPALNVGQRGEWRALIELQRGIEEAEQPEWGAVADRWGRALKKDVLQMARASEDASTAASFTDLRALALELLGNGESWNQYSYKQFRDAESSDRACYQALVRRPTSIERLHSIEEIEEPLLLKIHRYPTHPIADALGLVVQSTHMTSTGRVDYFQPSRPFSLNVNLRTDLPENVCWRSRVDPPGAGRNTYAGWYVSEGTGFFRESRPTNVGPDLVRYLEDGRTALRPDPFSPQDNHPDRLQHKCRIWADAAESNPELFLTRARAEQAVTHEALEPQMVVHAVLSNEWNNAGDSRWRQRRETIQRNAGTAVAGEQPLDALPTFVIPRASVGSAADELFPEAERVTNVGSDADYWAPPARNG